MRGWEIGLRDVVKVFCLACAGVGERVGGIWLRSDEELIEGSGSETASLLLVDGPCSEGGESHWTALSVCLHPRWEEHKEKGAGFSEKYRKVSTNRSLSCQPSVHRHPGRIYFPGNQYKNTNKEEIGTQSSGQTKLFSACERVTSRQSVTFCVILQKHWANKTKSAVPEVLSQRVLSLLLFFFLQFCCICTLAAWISNNLLRCPS